MVDELLPCPFCGSEAEVYVNSRGYKMVACVDCEAEADLGIWDARVCSCHGDYHIVDANKKVDHIPDASKMIWVSADDRLPDEGQEVLYYTKVSGALLGRYREDGVFGNVFGELAWGGGVYWMPLPEPPNV